MIKNLFIILFLNCVCASASTNLNPKYGSYPFEDRTEFRVYVSDAKAVSVRVYGLQGGFEDFPMEKLNPKTESGVDDTLLNNTWILTLGADLTNRSYHYVPYSINNIEYDQIDQNTLEAPRKDVDLFLFDKNSGYLIDTSARGFRIIKSGPEEMDLAGEIITKLKTESKTTFRLKGTHQLNDYFVQLSTEKTFPKRIDGYPTADPYCLDLLDNNACRIRSKPRQKLKQIGFRPGHAIHEVHIKDLTYMLAGIPDEIKGTYKAISHPVTLKLLKNMQVSTLEFLPLHSFDRMAAPPGHINYWGYMTRGFFALHRDYSHNRNNSIEEFQEAVNALHSIGISVIMDVVYNHTSEGDHRGPTVSFKNLARDDYFRMWDPKRGFYLNSTGVGNTCKSESAVMRKLIIDSLVYFTEYFGIDGYRFDLGAAIDQETFIRIRKALPVGTLLTAEPWVAADGAKWDRKDLNQIGMGKWSDGFRKDIRGDYYNPGWINGEGNENTVKVLLRGEDSRFGGSGSYVYANPGDINPFSVINEVEVHDGYTLFDWLKRFDIDDDAILRRMRLAHTLMLVSVQTPILQLGQEFARSKKGDKNSYDKDSEINWIDWQRASKEEFAKLNRFTNNLKKLRLHYDAFHFDKRVNNDRIIFINDKDNNQSAFGVIMRGSKYEFLILLNGSGKYGANFRFYNATYDLISDGATVNQRGLSKIIGGHYYLNPSSSAILRRQL